MPRTTQLFLGLVAASGILFALIVAHWPTLESWLVPPLIWPLFVALALDLLSRHAIQAGRVAEVSMNIRFIGVMAGALLYLATRFLVPTV